MRDDTSKEVVVVMGKGVRKIFLLDSFLFCSKCSFTDYIFVVVVLSNTRVFKFLLIIKHLPTAVYINESGSGWYIRKANAKLEVKNKTRLANKKISKRRNTMRKLLIGMFLFFISLFAFAPVYAQEIEQEAEEVVVQEVNNISGADTAFIIILQLLL